MEIGKVDWSGEWDGEFFEIEVNGRHVKGCHWRHDSPKFVFVFFHGLCSSISHNANFLREFPQIGGSSIATDHIGHGKSQGLPALTTVDEMVEEMCSLLRYARVNYPSTPIFLMGHSLGGLVMLTFLLKHRIEISFLKGVIAHAPWLSSAGGKDPKGWLLKVLKVLARFTPGKQIDSGLRIQYSPYPQEYKEMALALPFLCMNVTPSLLYSTVWAKEFVRNNVELYPRELPMLFLQGMKDSCVEIDVNLEWCSRLKELCGESSIAIKTLDEGFHDLYKSETRKESFDALLEFIERYRK